MLKGLLERCVSNPPCIDDWVSGRRGADFKNDKLGVSCRVWCYHNGNYVTCEATAEVSGDAFLLAISKIEKTIGNWRT